MYASHGEWQPCSSQNTGFHTFTSSTVRATGPVFSTACTKLSSNASTLPGAQRLVSPLARRLHPQYLFLDKNRRDIK
jgi:hypothetical protein